LSSASSAAACYNPCNHAARGNDIVPVAEALKPNSRVSNEKSKSISRRPETSPKKEVVQRFKLVTCTALFCVGPISLTLLII